MYLYLVYSIFFLKLMSLWILNKENMIVFKYQRLFSLSPLKLIQMRQKKYLKYDKNGKTLTNS